MYRYSILSRNHYTLCWPFYAAGNSWLLLSLSPHNALNVYQDEQALWCTHHAGFFLENGQLIIYNHCIVIFQIDRLIAIKNPIFHLCRVTNSLSVKGEWIDKIINFLQIILVIIFAKIWILLIIGGQAFLDPEVVKGEFSV